MIRHWMVACCLLSLAGCVSTKNVKADAAMAQGRGYASVALTSRAPPDFAAMTAGKAGFGLIGAAAMISAGNTIVRENNVEDPALRIGNALLAALAQQWGVPATEKSAHVTKSTKPVELAAEYPQSALLLDVQTVSWNFVYFPTDWNNYRVIYSVKVRLIDTQNQKLLAEGFCSRVPDQAPNAPSRQELLADKAAGLKAELSMAVDKCIPELASNVLGIQT